MRRFKLLSVLAGLITALAVSASPAAAWWESQSASTQGLIKVLNGHGGTFEDEKIPVKCPEKEVTGVWQIQTKGQIKEHQVGTKQQPTTFGPHLNIQVKWGKGFDCKATILGIPFPTEVKPCELQLVQQKESSTATGGVVTSCVIRIGEVKVECELTVPAAMESQRGSNEGINVGLLSTSLANTGIGGSQVDKVNVTEGGKGQLGKGVRVEPGPQKVCPLTNENGKLTELEFEAEGVKFV